MTPAAAIGLRSAVLCAVSAALAMYVLIGPDAAAWCLAGAAVGQEIIIGMLREE